MSSCSHSFYAPNDNIMVQLKEKNEFTISGSVVALPNPFDLSTEAEYSISTFQVGYSPIKHLAIAGSYFSLNDVEKEIYPVQGKGKIWNGALGTYYFINFREKDNIPDFHDYKVDASDKPFGLLFDLYAGYGEGNVQNTYYEGAKSIVDFQNYFIQGGFHFKSQYFDAGFSLKKSILNYHNFETYYEINDADLNDIQNLMRNNTYNPLHLNMRVSGGFPFGKVYLNLNDVINETEELKTLDFNVTLGIQLNVHDIFKSLKKRSK